MSFVTARIAVAIDSGMNAHVWAVSPLLDDDDAKKLMEIETRGMKIIARGVLAVAVPEVER